MLSKLIDTNVHALMLSSVAYTYHLDHSCEISHVLLGLAGSVAQHMHGTVSFMLELGKKPVPIIIC